MRTLSFSEKKGDPCLEPEAMLSTSKSKVESLCSKASGSPTRHHASEWRYFTMQIRNPLKTPVRRATRRFGLPECDPSTVQGCSEEVRRFLLGFSKITKLQSERRCWPWHWRCVILGSKGFKQGLRSGASMACADDGDDDDDQFHRHPHHRGLDHHLCHEQHHYRQRRCIAVIIGIFTISITIITRLDAVVFPSSSATFSSDFSFSP